MAVAADMGMSLLVTVNGLRLLRHRRAAPMRETPQASTSSHAR